jgi:hypothetical protein
MFDSFPDAETDLRFVFREKLTQLANECNTEELKNHGLSL